MNKSAPQAGRLNGRVDRGTDTAGPHDAVLCPASPSAFMTELLPAPNLAPSSECAPPPGGPRCPPLRVMSFNVRFGTAPDGPNRWELRHDLLARTVRRFEPDLLGVQEAMDFQCADLRRALGDDYAFHGAGREDGKERGEFTPVFVRRDRFERLAA